jgi:hypothetical protein
VSELLDVLRTDVLWNRRRGNYTIAGDIENAVHEIERLRQAIAAEPKVVEALTAINIQRRRADAAEDKLALALDALRDIAEDGPDKWTAEGMARIALEVIKEVGHE